MNRLLSAALALLAVVAWSSEGWSRTTRHTCDVNGWVGERLDNWKQQLARSTPDDPTPIVGTYDFRHVVLLPTCADGPLTRESELIAYFKVFLENRPVVYFESRSVGGVCGNAFASGLYNFKLNGGSGPTLRARYTFVFQGPVAGGAPIMQHHSSLEPETRDQQCPDHPH